jgi:hypothetical protein
MHKDWCLYFEENIARLIGWIDGVFVSCVYYNEDDEEFLEQDYEIFKGGKKGGFDVSKIRNIDK